MSEVSVFDAYQVQRALRGHLADGDAMQSLARDEATGTYWVLTGLELLLVKDQQPLLRWPREALRGEVVAGDVAETVRLQGAGSGQPVLGTFRKANRLTKALAEIVQPPAR